MKIRNILILQTIIVLAVVIFSLNIGGDFYASSAKASNFEKLTRFASSAGVLITFGSMIIAFRVDAHFLFKLLAIISLTGIVTCALAGEYLESAGNYTQTLSIMHISSFMALASSATFLIFSVLEKEDKVSK